MFDTSTKIFDNVSDLRLRAGGFDGAKAIVLNTGTDNEIVGAAWDESSALPDDGATVIQVNGLDTGRWLVKTAHLGQAIRDLARSNAAAYWAKVAPNEDGDQTAPVTILWRGNSAAYGLDTGSGGTLPPINGAPVNRDRNPNNSVDVMQAVLTECLLTATVVNQGYPYDRTVDGLERWKDEPTDGDAIILEYGINDAMNYEDRTTQGYTIVPLDVFRNNLRKMVVDQIFLGRRVLLEIPPIPEPRFSLQGQGLQSDNYYIRQYMAIVKDVAEEFGVELLDTDAWTNHIQSRTIQDELKLSWSNLSATTMAWRGQTVAGTFLTAKPVEGFAGKKYTYQSMAAAIRFVYGPVVPTATVDNKVAQLPANQTCSMVLDIKDRCELVFRGMIGINPERVIEVVVGGGVLTPPVPVTVAASGSMEPRYTRTGIILEPGLNTIMLRNASENVFLLDQIWLRIPREDTIQAPALRLLEDADVEIGFEDRFLILPEITADRLISRHSGEAFQGECIVIHNRNTSAFTWSTDRMKDTLGNMVTELPNGTVTVLQSDGTSNWVILSQTYAVGDVPTWILNLIARSNASAYWEKVRSDDPLNPVSIIWRGTSLTYGQRNGGPGAPINGATQARSATPSPEEMQRVLRLVGLTGGQATVVNQGYPGDRTSEGLTRWEDDVTPADAIIIEYMGNDSENFGGLPGGRIPLAQFKENLKKIVIREILKGRRVLIEIPPYASPTPDGLVNRQQRIKAYAEVAIEVARQYGCEVFSTNEAVLNRTKGWGRWDDGIHLTDTAYAHRGAIMAGMFLVADPPVATIGSEFAWSDGALLYTSSNPSVPLAKYNTLCPQLLVGTARAIVLDVKEKCELFLYAINTSGSDSFTIEYGSFTPIVINIPVDTNSRVPLRTGIVLAPGRATVVLNNTGPNTVFIDTIVCAPLSEFVDSPAIYTATDANYTIPDDARFVILPEITADRELTVPPGTGYRGEDLIIINRNNSQFKWTVPFNIVLPAAAEGFDYVPNNAVLWTKSDGVDWVASRELLDIAELIRETAKSNAAAYWQKVQDGTNVSIIFRGDENVYGLDKSGTGTLPAINGAPGTETRSSNPTPESMQAVFEFTENAGAPLLDATTINQGYPTDRITDGLTRWQADVTAADAIIISYFIADTFNTGGLPGGPTAVATYKETLKDMVILEVLKGRRVLLELAPLPYDYIGGLHSKNHEMRQLHAIAREVAEQFGCEIIEGQQIVSEIQTTRWTDINNRLLNVNAHLLRGWMIAGHFMNAHPKEVYAGDKYSYAEQIFWFSGANNTAPSSTYDSSVMLIGEGTRVMVVNAKERVQFCFRWWMGQTPGTIEVRRGISPTETYSSSGAGGNMLDVRTGLILNPGINVILFTNTTWVDTGTGELDDEGTFYFDEISFLSPAEALSNSEVEDSRTTWPTIAELNADYPGAEKGFLVICREIVGGGAIFNCEGSGAWGYTQYTKLT